MSGPTPSLEVLDEAEERPWHTTWLRTANLPWANVVAAWGAWVVVYHFGPLVVWFTTEVAAVAWNHRVWTLWEARSTGE